MGHGALGVTNACPRPGLLPAGTGSALNSLSRACVSCSTLGNMGWGRGSPWAPLETLQGRTCVHSQICKYTESPPHVSIITAQAHMLHINLHTHKHTVCMKHMCTPPKHTYRYAPSLGDTEFTFMCTHATCLYGDRFEHTDPPHLATCTHMYN